MSKVIHTAKKMLGLRRHDGALTERLVQEPGVFGLGRVPRRFKPDAVVDSVCGFCSTGCSLSIHLKDSVGVNLTPNSDYPVNLGMACPKGWEALAPLSASDRVTMPLLRDEKGNMKEVSWQEAMNAFVGRFKGIQKKHGAASVAFLSTGQIVTEEMAFLGALAKFGMGILHGDGNTRQCMATAVTAYKQSFGFDAPPYSYDDFENSDVLVFIGANPCIAHPIMWQRVMRNRRDPEIVVIDPRKTETAMAATRHLAIEPKSDLAFFYGLAKTLIDLNLIDREFIEKHTDDFDAFAAFVSEYNLARVSRKSGVPETEIESLARLIGSGRRVSFWWTMGVNQSYEGVRVAQSLINLALMTGNIGRPGTGANSITGQCNAMGSRLFSNTTALFCGRDFENPDDRRDVANRLKIPMAAIPAENSWAYDRIVDGIESGEIRGLWLIATNTAHSWINRNRFQQLRKKLEFLVVQDMFYNTDSAAMADLVLPAAGWGEKDGTFINSERRIGRTRKVRKAPGQALADFQIFRLVAHSWGCGEMFDEWNSPAATFQIMKRLSEKTPCDISGIRDYDHLDTEGGIQWPLPKGSEDCRQHRRLFEDGRFFRPNDRALFRFETPRELPEPRDEDFPILLLTGRGTSSQWHTQTRTSKSDVLRKLYPEDAYIEINFSDAARLGIEPNEKIAVVSRRGRIVADAFVVDSVKAGQAFMPMHYAETNHLTHASFDPYSRQPSYKASAIRLEKIEFRTTLL